MCGDGANDCGALKTADVGISLSEAEASIAAPFTSQIQNIDCCVTLLREGRAAMTTSFQAFKFIELYSFIQFFSCILLYCIDAVITDHQFLYIDLIALVPLSIFQAWTGAYEKLTKDVPTASLFYAPVLTSVFSSAAIQLAFQVYFFFTVQNHEFYYPPTNISKSDDFNKIRLVSFQSTVLFQLTNFQYLVTCCSFSVAYPFRKNVWTNYPFSISILVILVLDSLFIFLQNPNWLSTFFDVLSYDGESSYTYVVALGVVINTLMTYACEKFIVTQLTRMSDRRLAKNKRRGFSKQMEELALQNRHRSQTGDQRSDDDQNLDSMGAAVAERLDIAQDYGGREALR